MKKIFVLLLCSLLIGASIHAGAPIPARFDSLKLSVLSRFNASGVVTGQLSALRVQFAINEAITAVCTNFPAVTDTTTLGLDSTTEGNALPADFDRLRIVFRVSGDTMRYPLQIIDADSGMALRMLMSNRHSYEVEKVTSIALDSAAEGIALPDDFDNLLMAFRKIGDTLRQPLVMVSPDSARVLIKSTEKHIHTQGDITSPSYVYTVGQKIYTHPKFKGDVVVGDSLLIFYQAVQPSYVFAYGKTIYTHPQIMYDSLMVMYYAIDQQLDAAADTTLILSRYRGALINYAVSILYEQVGLFHESSFFMGKYDYAAAKQKSSKRAVSYQEITQ